MSAPQSPALALITLPALRALMRSAATLLCVPLLAALVAGCETVSTDDIERPPAPSPTYSGPVAKIGDTGTFESGNRAVIFMVAAIDDNPVPTTISDFRAPLAMPGRPFAERLRFSERQVPARPAGLLLRAAYLTSTGTFGLDTVFGKTSRRAEVMVEFTPVAGRTYAVRGEMREDGATFWIEDAFTFEAATPRIAATSFSR